MRSAMPICRHMLRAQRWLRDLPIAAERDMRHQLYGDGPASTLHFHTRLKDTPMPLRMMLPPLPLGFHVNTQHLRHDPILLWGYRIGQLTIRLFITCRH